MSGDEREQVIARICERTGKTREQAEAFLAILASGFRRRGWIEGEPEPEARTAELFDTFLGRGPQW